jgi:transcriptional regulator with XRE-family HTH domain
MPASLFTAAYEQLVASVVAMRKEAGLTQRQLAAKLGREQNYVARIETRQRRLDLVELIQLCRACGKEPEAAVSALVRKIAGAVPLPKAKSKR